MTQRNCRLIAASDETRSVVGEGAPRGALEGPGQPRTGSMRGAVEITLDLRPPHLAARRLPFDARPVLVGCAARVLAVANHAGTNDDQELGAVDVVVLGAERIAEHGNVAEDRYRASADGVALLNEAAEGDHLAVSNGDRGLDTALLDRR